MTSAATLVAFSHVSVTFAKFVRSFNARSVRVSLYCVQVAVVQLRSFSAVSPPWIEVSKDLAKAPLTAFSDQSVISLLISSYFPPSHVFF
ncbi:hypothetical protein SRABI06_05739 [Pseudomonas brassicacearum]|nr:hypothetical protein SRABI06_05739 [Pseudomonas brassicacearum]